MRQMPCILLILILLLCSCGQPSTTGEEGDNAPTWQEQYDLGVRYMEEGNYEEAVIAFTAAIEIDPKQASAYVGRGNAYVLSGETEDNFAAAQADYEKAIELDEASTKAYLSLADLYIHQENYEMALEVLQWGLKKTDMDQDILDVITELEAKSTYGQTEFTHRTQYCIFESMSTDQKNLIELAVSAAIDQDTIKFFNLYKERTWDDPNIFIGERYSVYHYF